ncbi:MAG TPA: SigE family RNA polymerase sigma factor [Nocardioides sp.]
MVRDTEQADFADYAAARWTTLVRAAMLLGCPLHDAEDLVQTTLEKAFVSWRKVEQAQHRDAYVSAMLLNTMRASRRRRWWRERPTESLPESTAPDSETDLAARDAVERALGSLTKEQREVVVLRFHLQLSEAETARVLGIPPGTAKSRLSRALSTLSTSPHLSEHQGEHHG